MRRKHAERLAWGQALITAMGWTNHLKTQTALARRSGVPQSTIGRILRGEVDPQSGNLHCLARALGMTLTALARIAEDAEMQGAPALRLGRVPAEEVDRAMLNALACREDLKCAEQTVESLRRKEQYAIERLEDLVQGLQTKDGTEAGG